VTFTATGLADSPTSIEIAQGDGQVAVTGTNVAIAPTVIVRDQYDNPAPDNTVTFTQTGGSVGSPSPSTGATGQASTTWAPNVSGGTMQANGTFPDTLFATVAGTALSTSFTASARYSYATSVAPIWSCAGCHGGWTYAALVDVAPTCDATLGALYRRVSSAGGVAAADTYSILMRLVDAAVADVGNCGNSGGSPYVHPTLTDPNLSIVRAWIRNGAPNN
jgi:hypothetical protein